MLLLGTTVASYASTPHTSVRPESPLSYKLERVSYKGYSEQELADAVYCTASASHSGVECIKQNGTLCTDMHRTPVAHKSWQDEYFFKRTAGDGSRHPLPDYQPLYESPIRSMSTDLTRHELWHYRQTPPAGRATVTCPYCGGETNYIADVFHDVSACNHAVFSAGDYCKSCDRYQPTDYYDTCGC